MSSTVRASNEPDVKKIFSRAALNAIEEEHRQRGTLGHGFGPAESFYVVPPFAHTKPYAQVVRGKRGDAGGLGEDDEDAFVDAREAQGPPSPKHSRTGSGARRSVFGKGRTAEELELENTTLKQTLEGLANRLADFEAHAQDASMAALTQSMIGLRPPGSASDGHAAAAERVRQLEQQIENDAEERQKLEARAKQQEKQMRAYTERYQLLRGNARKKMEAKERAKQSEEDELAVDDPMPGAA